MQNLIKIIIYPLETLYSTIMPHGSLLSSSTGIVILMSPVLKVWRQRLFGYSVCLSLCLSVIPSHMKIATFKVKMVTQLPNVDCKFISRSYIRTVLASHASWCALHLMCMIRTSIM